MAWGAIASAGAKLGATFGGGAITGKQQRKAAKSQRKWMEYMSNTAHQREVKDLRAAGLNPILSAMGGGGASTPGASMAQVPDYSKASGDIPDASTAVKVKSEKDLLRLQALNVKKQVDKTQTEIDMLQTQFPQLEAIRDFYSSEKGIATLETGLITQALPTTAASIAAQAGFNSQHQKTPSSVSSLSNLPSAIQRKLKSWLRPKPPQKNPMRTKRSGATGRYRKKSGASGRY